MAFKTVVIPRAVSPISFPVSPMAKTPTLGVSKLAKPLSVVWGSLRNIGGGLFGVAGPARRSTPIAAPVLGGRLIK